MNQTLWHSKEKVSRWIGILLPCLNNPASKKCEWGPLRVLWDETVHWQVIVAFWFEN